MDNKYYTPSLEEFYIGFEHEINHKVRDGSGNRQWDLDIYRGSSKQTRFIKFLLEEQPENIRIKYLDKRDIEEALGEADFFKEGESKHLQNKKYKSFHFKKYNIMMALYPETHKITIATLDPSKNKTFFNTGWDDKQVNLIECKNKYELKKLLQQLNI